MASAGIYPLNRQLMKLKNVGLSQFANLIDVDQVRDQIDLVDRVLVFESGLLRLSAKKR